MNAAQVATDLLTGLDLVTRLLPWIEEKKRQYDEAKARGEISVEQQQLVESKHQLLVTKGFAFD